jgi:predicted nucleotidyltransferase
MDSQSVIEILRDHRIELENAGILHLRIFGSVARNEAYAASDVDLMAEFDRSKQLNLVKLGSLQSRLAAILGAPVDLTSAAWMKDPIRSQAEREALVAF